MYDQVIARLESDGWEKIAPYIWRKSFKSEGEFGRRGVLIQLDNARYLERIDGWGKVEKDVDLRRYEDPGEAIADVLKGV